MLKIRGGFSQLKIKVRQVYSPAWFCSSYEFSCSKKIRV